MSILNLIADRFRDKNFDLTKPDYKFIKIKRIKENISKSNPNIKILDFGIGEPDLPADSSIVSVLYSEAKKSENRFYADNGIQEFKNAASNYLKYMFNVDNINPSKDIIHGIGAKSILSMLPLCFINAGDVTITTIPSYPVLATHTKYLGGTVYGLPLTKANNFYPILSDIPDIILKKCKLMYINYPNNPTAQIPTKDFYEKVVDFAYKNEIIVIADSTYAPLTFDNVEPLSFLSVPGAKEVGVEIHSLSKAFNMTGWRLAFMAGNPEIINIFGVVKGNSDSGQFRAIQKAGIYALNHPEIIEVNKARYSRRLELLVTTLKKIGFTVEKSKATFYCYTPIPKGTKSGIVFENAEDFSLFLLNEAYICTVPWNTPEPYVRFSVTFETKDISEEDFIKELEKRLNSLNLIF